MENPKIQVHTINATVDLQARDSSAIGVNFDIVGALDAGVWSHGSNQGEDNGESLEKHLVGVYVSRE